MVYVYYTVGTVCSFRLLDKEKLLKTYFLAWQTPILCHFPWSQVVWIHLKGFCHSLILERCIHPFINHKPATSIIIAVMCTLKTFSPELFLYFNFFYNKCQSTQHIDLWSISQMCEERINNLFRIPLAIKDIPILHCLK